MTITRSEVIKRMTTVWAPYTVPYSMALDQDCSAYVRKVWGIPTDENTVTLVTEKWMYEIDPNELRAGDAVGHCGPGTSGAAGHVQLFERWLNDDDSDNHYWCWHQNGNGPGPRRDLIDFPVGYYKAYRFKDIVEDVVATAVLRRPWPNLPTGHYFGLITGPNQSHGGYRLADREHVRAIQDRLKDLGYAEVGPSDGIFGPNTQRGLARWQRENYASQTLRFGELWPNGWARLFTY